MKKNSTIYFKTKNGNAYLYDFNRKTYHNAPAFFDDAAQIATLCKTKDESLLQKHAIGHGCSKSELKEYLHTAKYLMENGYFGIIGKEIRTLNSINEKVVQYNIRRIKHLVFEVTESCNLQCHYCGYGKLYGYVPGRHNAKLPFEKAKALIDYLSLFWKQDKGRNKTIAVSFYGGEPLMNFDFIEKVVDYLIQLDLFKTINFSITTNGVLLLKHIDFLIKHNFKTDVSLDGDFEGNQYRVDLNNKNVHGIVIGNIEQIRQKHPDYFEKRISFQSVLSNVNSVESITRFFKEKFGKKVSILELNMSDVVDETEFNRIFRDYFESLNEASEDTKKLYYYDSPETSRMGNVIFNMLKNTCFNIKDTPKYSMLEPKDKTITATCTPFWKKLFVTAKGDLMPCEKINYKYIVGTIDDENHVLIDPEEIIEKYNRYYKSLTEQCALCYSSPFCVQCMFYVEHLGENPICQDSMDEKAVCEYFSNMFGFFEDNIDTVYSLINCTFYE